jgi:hypothetical protein
MRQLRSVLLNDLVAHAEALAYLPNTERMRLELMTTAVRHYDDFLKARPRDLQLKNEAARVFWHAANVGRLLEVDEPGTQLLYERASALAKMVAAATGARTDLRLVARVLNDRGNWHHARGRLDDAEADLLAALDRLPPDGAASGAEFDERNDRQIEAMIWKSLASLRADSGRTDALETARRADGLFATLVRGGAATNTDKLLHAQALLIVARLTEQPAALDALGRAGALVDELAAGGVTDPDTEEVRAEIAVTRGRMHPEATGHDAALAAAIETYERLFDRQRETPSVRRGLVEALLAQTERGLDAANIAAAERYAARAAELCKIGEGRTQGHADLLQSGAAHALRARLAIARGAHDAAAPEFDAAVADLEAAAARAPGFATIREVLQAVRAARADALEARSGRGR